LPNPADSSTRWQIDGRNLFFTFALVTSLFLLWGFCNGMIDILNKHFQDSLHINKEQSGLVQSANYLAYFLMAIPAGLIARKFGYKGGILVGLALIASGAFWFIHATHIGEYWAFLLGLFVIAAGMTCLETIANPYTTVLGPQNTGRHASISPRRSTAWAGFSARLSAAILCSPAPRRQPMPMPALSTPYLGIGIL
jgi:MFS transporter, FHS family, L-fucose permease